MAESDDLVKPIPVGRPATTDEIAPTVLYVASDAAPYMAGEIVYVDGAWSIY
jgi:3-oxoacyl-[acyl-carrier protein] reductase